MWGKVLVSFEGGLSPSFLLPKRNAHVSSLVFDETNGLEIIERLLYFEHTSIYVHYMYSTTPDDSVSLINFVIKLNSTRRLTI